MGFINSLNEIAKNRKNFARWEQEQRDTQAKRDALNSSREHTPEELEKARALGENIINAIDVMDNHSESVSENVETAVAPLVGLSPFVGGGLATVASVKYLMSPAYSKIQDIRAEYLDTQAAKDLANEIKEHYKDSNKWILRDFDTRALLSEWQTRDIDNSILKKKVKDFQKEFSKKIANQSRKVQLGWFSIAAAAIASFVGANIYAAKLQVDGSKIARYQARKALEDPKAFVTYTPEQIEQAKAEIAAHPELKNVKKKQKLKQGFFKSIIGLFRDKEAYERAKITNIDESKLVTRPLTAEEIKQAERDKEVIQRTVKLVNNEAEKYSENMEVAAGVIFASTPILGATFGAATKWVLEKTGLLDKLVDGNIEKNGSEKTKQFYKEYKDLVAIKDKTPKQKIEQASKFWDFSYSFNRDLTHPENLMKNESSKKLPKVSFWQKMKRKFTTAMANRTGRGWAIAGIGALATGMAGLILSLKLQKASARAGRFTAKRELEKDPRNFIGYTQEDYKEVEDVKETKKETSKIKEYAMFIPNVLKQYWAYDKYRKNEFKNEQLLMDVLKRQEVSDEQLKDAKNLQRKIFNTFEKVDDNSQTYSESMEAAIEIAQPFVMYGSTLAALTPIIYYGNQLAKGRKNPADAVKKITNILAKSSNVMKTKLFKKYLNSVERNIPQVVQSTYVSSRPYGTILAGVSLGKDPVFEIVTKMWKNLKNTPEQLRNMSDADLNRFIKDLRSKCINYPDLGCRLEFIEKMPKEEKIDMLDILFNPESLKKMSSERFNKVIDNYEDVISSGYIRLVKNNEEKLHKLYSLSSEFEFSKKYKYAKEILGENNYEKLCEIMYDLSEYKLSTKLQATKKLRNMLAELEPNKLQSLFKDEDFFVEYLNKLELKPLPIRQMLADSLKDVPIGKLKEFISLPEMQKAMNETFKPEQIQNINRFLADLDSPRGLVDKAFDHKTLLDLVEFLEKQKNNKFLDKKLKDLIPLEKLKKLEENLVKATGGEFNISNIEQQVNQLVKANKRQILSVVSAKELKSMLSYLKRLSNNLESGIEVSPTLDKLAKSLKLDLKVNEGKASVQDIMQALMTLPSKAKTYTLKDIYNMAPEKYSNPKQFLANIKKSVTDMTDEQLAKKLEGTPLSDFDKKTALDVLNNIEKMFDNIPKEEVQKIFDTAVEEFSKNPDEFIKLVKNNDVGKLFNTPELRRALQVAGISWVVFNVIISYAIESWLAELQLKAGRLGVMKSLEDLQDNRYYANIEKDSP